MPPKKEPKEAVVYAASKRKAPPFKPVRPSQKISRVSTTESESSTVRRPSISRQVPAKQRTIPQDNVNEDDGQAHDNQSDDSDEELADNPLSRPLARQIVKPKPAKPPAPHRKTTREASPMSVSDDEPDNDSLPASPGAAGPSADGQPNIPPIPQPLLVRLLHEHFADKTTKIDKHAVQVLQKYLEMFVREAIARAALRKKEDPAVSDIDSGWLEGDDLEKIAAGMVLDF